MNKVERETQTEDRQEKKTALTGVNAKCEDRRR